MQEGQDALVAIGNVDDGEVYSRHGGRAGTQNIFAGKAGDEKHRQRDDQNFERGAEIGFDDDEAEHYDHHAGGGHNRVAEIVHAEAAGPAAEIEKPGEVEDDRELGQLGGL